MSPDPGQPTDTLVAATNVQPKPAAESSNLGQVYDSFGMNPRTLRFFLLERGWMSRAVKWTFSARRTGSQLTSSSIRPANCCARAFRRHDHLRNPGHLRICRGTRSDAFTDRPDSRRTGGHPHVVAPRGAEHLRADGPGFLLFGSARAVRVALPVPARGCRGAQGKARDGMRWVDGSMEGDWLAGDRFTAVDICLYCYIDQLCEMGQAIGRLQQSPGLVRTGWSASGG